MKAKRITPIVVTLALLGGLNAFAQSRVVTLTAAGPNSSNYVAIASNEVAEVVGWYDNREGTSSSTISMTKNGSTAQVTYEPSQSSDGPIFPNARTLPKIAGPCTIALSHDASSGSTAYSYITIEITPEAFPAGQTLILPEGVVGIVHVESTTNLINWQDEWSQTFSNTNENRFFRLRADLVTP